MKFYKQFFILCRKAAEELGIDKSNGAKTYTSIKSYLMWKYDQMYGKYDGDIILKERILNLRSDEINNAKKNINSRYKSKKSDFSYPYFRFGKYNELVFDKVLEYLQNIKEDEEKEFLDMLSRICIDASMYYGMTKDDGIRVVEFIKKYSDLKYGPSLTRDDIDFIISIKSQTLHATYLSSFTEIDGLILEEVKLRLKRMKVYCEKFNSWEKMDDEV